MFSLRSQGSKKNSECQGSAVQSQASLVDPVGLHRTLRDGAHFEHTMHKTNVVTWRSNKIAWVAESSPQQHSKVSYNAPGAQRARTEVAVRTLCVLVTVAQRLYSVLWDVTASLLLHSLSTARTRSFIFFTALLQRLYGAAMAITVLPRWPLSMTLRRCQGVHSTPKALPPRSLAFA